MALNLYESDYEGPEGFPPTDCTQTALPDPEFTDCPESYVTHEGEIDVLWMTHLEYNSGTAQWEAANVPTNHETTAGFVVAGIEKLIGFGDKPLSEPLTVPLPHGLTKTHNRRHTLNFDITDQSIANYELVRALQGLQYVAIWYKTIDGDGFGGENGIIARVVNAGNVHARGEGALLTGTIVLEWKKLFDPPRVILDAPAPMTTGKVQAPAALKSNKSAAPKAASKVAEEATA